MATRIQSIDVPDLDHDAMMLARFGRKVHPTGRLERRIVAALCAHMLERGWRPLELFDGEETAGVSDARSAMELIFNLDESRLTFSNGSTRHTVLLINGNGVDMISDWSFYSDDRDGFNAAMDAFDAEAFA